MLPSTSVQKFNSNKKSKKKPQHFKDQELKSSTPLVEAEVKVSVPPIKNEKVGESHTARIDLKDFPELKVSENQRGRFGPGSKSRFTDAKPQLSIITDRREKKLISEFPNLSNIDNSKNIEIGSSAKEDVVSEFLLENTALVSTNPTLEKKKEMNSNPKAALQKAAFQPHRNPNKKKRSDPVFINFQDILTINKALKKGRKQNTLRSKLQRRNIKEPLSGNVLDSSNPKRSRGKHREIKKKKLSNFKRTIIKERILKTKLRENTNSSQFECKPVNLCDIIDIKSEIKIYLNKLKDRKLKNLNSKKTNKPNENYQSEKTNKGEEKNVETKVEIKKEEEFQNPVGQKKKIIPQITAEGEIKFSTKFREYCDNIITSDLNSAVAKLIEELIKLQDRSFARDQIKAKAKKRHVSGIREVKKYLALKKAKMIIIAPNLEKLQMEGSVYDSINELKSLANSQNVPYGFALDRYKLGRCTRKNVPVSAFAVLNCEGIETLFQNALHHLLDSKNKFLELTKPKLEDSSEEINSKVLSTLVTAIKEELNLTTEDSSHSD